MTLRKCLQRFLIQCSDLFNMLNNQWNLVGRQFGELNHLFLTLLIIFKPIFKAKTRVQSLIWWSNLQTTIPIVFGGRFFWPWNLFKWVTLTWFFKWLIWLKLFGQTGHWGRLLTRSCFLLKCTAKSIKSSNFSSHFAQELSVKSEFLAFSS